MPYGFQGCRETQCSFVLEFWAYSYRLRSLITLWLPYAVEANPRGEPRVGKFLHFMLVVLNPVSPSSLVWIKESSWLVTFLIAMNMYFTM